MFYNQKILNREKYNNLILLLGLFILPTTYCILRSIGSVDTSAYFIIFNNYKTENEIEKSYKFICSICSWVDNGIFGFRLVLAFYAIVSSFFLFRIILRSPYIVLSFIIYFLYNYILQMSVQMRSGLACLMCVDALCNLSDNRNEKYSFIGFYIEALIGCLFHKVAMFFLPIHILTAINKKIPKLIPILPFVYFAIAFFSYNAIDSFFIYNYDNLDKSNMIISKIYDYYNVEKNNIHFINFLLLLGIVIYYLIFFYRKYFNKDFYYSYMTVLSYGFFIHFLGYYFIPIISFRGFELILTFFTVLIPYVVYSLKEKKLVVLILIAYGILHFVTICKICGFI